LKLASTAGRRKSIASPGLERVVGGDDRKHRRHLRVDHPRALGHPAAVKPAPARDGLLRGRVGGEDRLGGSEPPSGASAAAAPRTPARTFESGSGTPITPVERTTISSASRSSSRAASAAVASASSSPRSPRRGVRVRGVRDDRLAARPARGAAARRRRARRGRGLTVNMPAPVEGTSERTIATSGRARRSPQWTPLAANPLAAVTLTASPPRPSVQLPPGGPGDPADTVSSKVCRVCDGGVPDVLTSAARPSDRDSGELQAEGLVQAERHVRVLHCLGPSAPLPGCRARRRR